MSQADIIRAWREPEYRSSLSEAELVLIPSHPAGFSEIRKDVLTGGPTGSISPFSYIYSCMVICGLF
jgi:mersacidin/lichenicidin family type 2 lantibiotic